MSKSSKIIFIIGPTAVGKTDIAVSIAAKVNAEIVSADSMAVYRQMNIGVAKPSEEQQRKIKHHLIDVVDIREEFTVAKYQELALKALDEIRTKKKVPIIVGGTGLYIQALTRGLFDGPGADWELREQLQRQEQQNPGSLHEELNRIDPTTAHKLEPNDVRRIIRAIEVYRHTKKPISSFQTQWEHKEHGYLKLGLTMERSLLYRRIEQRCDWMIAEGLIKETRHLIKLGIERNRTAMQAIGYKEIIDWLNGRVEREQALVNFKTASRRLAKRQLTWFKKDATIHWKQIDESNVVSLRKKLVTQITEYLAT